MVNYDLTQFVLNTIAKAIMFWIGWYAHKYISKKKEAAHKVETYGEKTKWSQQEQTTE